MVKYDYLMLKPESQKKFPEIYDKIQRSKLGSIKLYGVIDWINYLFGNEAIVVLIKNIYDNENFEKDILKFKKEIREKYSESDKLYLLINLAKVKEINTDKTKTSEIILKDKSR